MTILSNVSDASILLKFSENSYLVKLTIRELLDLKITNWAFNRQPDESRIEEIKNFICEPKKIINSLFHFSIDKKTDIYEILDGAHRYTAIKNIDYKIFEETLEKTVLIMVYINHSKGELIDIFDNLNKSQSVPEIYISKDIEEDEKKIIESVVLKWCSRYKTHFSPNINFRSPQINREIFTNLVMNIREQLNIKKEEKLLDVLNILNNFVESHINSTEVPKNLERKLPKKFTDKQIEKCNKSGCYLFLYKDSIILETILKLDVVSQQIGQNIIKDI